MLRQGRLISFIGEELVTPNFDAVVTDVKDLGNGFWSATLPTTKADFLGTFNFKDLISLSGVDGQVEYTLGGKEQQNGNVKDRFDFLKTCLTSDGSWTMTARPGTNCNKKKEETGSYDGLLVYLKVADVVKAKVYWKVIDPLADVDFAGGLKGLSSKHMEHGDIFEKGANKYDIGKEITADNFDIRHGEAPQFIEAFKVYSISVGGETVVMNNGETLEVTEYGKKFTKFSKGLTWYNCQTSIIASRGNEGNGEIVAGWDGITAADMVDLGLKITSDGFFETTSAYGGWGLRVGMGLKFEYDYGEKPISEGCLAYIFFNRNVSPDGVTNIKPR